MVTLLSSRLTFVKELIPNADHYYRYCDACATGAGGVWFSGERNLQPIVWRVEFEQAIATQVVSNDNPHGRLTNSDLEMAALLLQYMVLHQEVEMWFARAGVLSNNTPTVAWTARMANKSNAPTAGQLLRGLAAIQRASQTGLLKVAFIAGVKNSMADVASHSFGQNRVPNAVFLQHFTNLFSLTITATILETCAPYARDELARDLDTAWNTIASATVDDGLQAKSRDHWLEYCSDGRRDPYLQDSSATI
jgi:hypothetical protein